MQRFIACFIAFSFSLAFSTWQSIGPYGGSLSALGVAPSDNNIMYAASQTIPSFICKSTDAGDSWTRICVLSNYPVFFAVDPADPNTVYAGYNNVFLKSTNGGTRWISRTMADNYYDLVVNPIQPSILYAAGESNDGSDYTMSFFKSTDAGFSWNHVHLNSYSGTCYSMCTDPADPNTIYVGGFYVPGSYCPAIYKSTDGGTNFTDVSSGIPSNCYVVYSLAVHPASPNIVYAGAYSSIYRSTIGGGSWSVVYAPGGYVRRLATTPANPNTVYAGADTAVYRSTDSGANWSFADSGLGGTTFSCLAAHNTDGNTVFTASSRGFFKSVDAGSSWSFSVAGMNIASIKCFGIACSTIYTESFGAGIYKTTDNGTTWTALSSPVSCGNICAFVVQNTNPNTVCLLENYGCPPTELYKSTDGGSTWSMIDGYYDDGGALIIDPNDTLVYYSGGTNGGMMAVSKSVDGGRTWSRYNLTTEWGFTYALAVDPSNSNNVYAAGDPALYKSTDAGMTWSFSSTGMSGIVRAITINQNNSNVLYSGTDIGVFKSIDAGASWADCGLDNVQALLVHPSAPETVYAGTKTGFFQSADSGNTWTEMNVGLDDLDVTSLGINPSNYLFCGTRNSSMYRKNLFVGVEEWCQQETKPVLAIYPNPFRRLVQIKCRFVSNPQHETQLPDPQPPCSRHDAWRMAGQTNSGFKATLKICDALGRIIKSFALSSSPSVLCIFWNGTDDAGQRLPAGVYFCRLECEGITAIEKIILLK